MQTTYWHVLYPAVLALVMVVIPAVSAGAADSVTQALNASDQTNHEAARSQKRIDKLDDQTRAMLQKYRSVLLRTRRLETYDKQLKKLISTQLQRGKSLQQQLDAIARTRHQLTPMILRMIDTLQAFINADLPFRLDQRRHRIKQLTAAMADPEQSVADRYRSVLKAYRKEVDYGRTIGAYKGRLPGKQGERTVQFLRLGRLALYYLTLDGADCGYWNRRTHRWQSLPGRYRGAIRQGIRLANKQSAPSLLELPVQSPEHGQ